MAPQLLAAPDYSKATDAKDFLDQIGQEIYKKVHKKDADYRNYLQGHLKDATYSRNSNGQETPSDPCQLLYEYHTNVTKGHGKEYPCLGKDTVRFSDESRNQCTSNRIRDSNDKCGACAPYRRLHLCDQHLEHMDTNKINNTHNLLLEVSLAAKHEGQSISVDHPRYHTDSSGSTICTVLARSFADIGDIIRGKDLYRGDKKKNQTEREKLEENLQKIFGIIYKNLMQDLKNDTKKMAEAEKRYTNDGDNYFQLREDWWTVNRATVWTAITCKAGSDSQYFRATCSNGLRRASKQCRCAANIDPPTYFDYVPQYLRWFEEWAEDFCRKKKKKSTKFGTTMSWKR